MSCKQLVLGVLMTSFLFSCASDDSGESASPEELEQQQQETIAILTNNNASEIWKIASASLTNGNGTYDISNNFNIQDDEFVFSENGTLEWRPGHDIRRNATSVENAKLDYYRSPNFTNYNFNSQSSNELTALNGDLTFSVSNGSITGQLAFDSGEALNFTLTIKQPGDYPTAPNSLNFTEAFTFDSSAIWCCSPALVGSYSANSIYFVNEEPLFGAGTGIPPERVIKFDVDTGAKQEIIFSNKDFVTKQPHIINDKLVVVSGEYVNTYPLDLSSQPESRSHGLAVTRFGTAVADDQAYIIGGDLDTDGDGNVEAEKVYRWDTSNETLQFITDLPEDRFGARGTIVNNKLYAFGGTEEFAQPDPIQKKSIYIYDLLNGSTSTQEMVTEAQYTYVDKQENLIYVAGRKVVDDLDWAFFVGVFNTLDNSYREIPTNLSQESWYVIYAMCILNDKMYVLYGREGEDTGGELERWYIYEANLD